MQTIGKLIMSKELIIMTFYSPEKIEEEFHENRSVVFALYVLV